MKKIIELFIILILLVVFVAIVKSKLAAFYYNKGNDYYDRHLYKGARDYFEKSLEINPSVAQVHYSLANIYMEEKLTNRAIEEYKIAVKLDNHFVLGYKALAYLYLKSKMYHEALSLLRQAEIFVSGDQEIRDLTNSVSFRYTADLLNTGVKAFLTGDRLKAQELLNKALRIKPNFAPTLYTLGYFYYAEHRYVEAEKILKQAVRSNSKLFLAHKLLGDIYFEKRIFNKSIDAYIDALAVNKQDPIILNNIGLAYMNLENYKEAIPFLKEASNLNPDNVNIRYSLASVYRDSDRLSEAVSEYRKVIAAQPDYPNVHNDLGDVYKQKRQTTEAFEEYHKEIFFCQNKILNNPKDTFTLIALAHAYNELGEYEKAKELIDQALVIKPDYQQAYLTLASILRNLGNSNDVVIALEEAKRLSPQKYFFIERSINDTQALTDVIEDEINPEPTVTVYLKNGRHLSGIIKKETKDNIILEINVGSSVGITTLSQDTIERIIRK